MVYTVEVIWANVPSVIEAHKIIKKFMKARIQVHSQLNITAWKSYLNKYWDKQIVDLLQYGFPLDFVPSRRLESTHINDSSVLKFPEHVKNYSKTEIEYGAILGPFQEHLFPCYISPF